MDEFWFDVVTYLTVATCFGALVFLILGGRVVL